MTAIIAAPQRRGGGLCSERPEGQSEENRIPTAANKMKHFPDTSTFCFGTT